MYVWVRLHSEKREVPKMTQAVQNFSAFYVCVVGDNTRLVDLDLVNVLFI